MDMTLGVEINLMFNPGYFEQFTQLQVCLECVMSYHVLSTARFPLTEYGQMLFLFL